MSVCPMFDPEQTWREVEVLNRAPFRRLLARILSHAPSDEALDHIAEKNPDRWAQTATQIARLGGYNEKLEVEGTLSQKIQDLSDSELAEQITRMQALLDMQSSVHTS